MRATQPPHTKSKSFLDKSLISTTEAQREAVRKNWRSWTKEEILQYNHNINEMCSRDYYQWLERFYAYKIMTDPGIIDRVPTIADPKFERKPRYRRPSLPVAKRRLKEAEEALDIAYKEMAKNATKRAIFKYTNREKKLTEAQAHYERVAALW